jgi:hypothetical protein
MEIYSLPNFYFSTTARQEKEEEKEHFTAKQNIKSDHKRFQKIAHWKLNVRRRVFDLLFLLLY